MNKYKEQNLEIKYNEAVVETDKKKRKENGWVASPNGSTKDEGGQG